MPKTFLNPYPQRGLAGALLRLKQNISLAERIKKEPHHFDPRHKEALTEQEFVRLFGTKSKVVRYSHRQDFVGLEIVGDRSGFRIERAPDMTQRRIILFIDRENGVNKPNGRFLLLAHDDSLSNMQRGLLKKVV